MELGGQEEDIGISMPIVSYAPPIIHEASKLKLLGGNGAATTGPGPVPDVSSEDNKPNNSGSSDQQMVVKKAVRYRECLKNHAASIGGHAIDGCGDFLPSGEEGTLEALKCAACNCHRNFHRREVEGEGTTMSSSPCYFCFKKEGGYPRKIGGGARPGLPSPAPGPLALPSISTRAIAPGFDNHEGGSTTPNPLHHHHHALAMVPGGSSSAPPMMMKKRFRTKFSQEQKEKMCSFAEKLGWRIQKHDESAVQQFCMELGIKRHVLKVWMHNNKHTLGKKL